LLQVGTRGSVQAVQQLLQEGLSPPALTFAAATVLVIAAATALCYSVYGQQYLDNAVLYHATRTDNRHNFSMYFYWIYLDYEVTLTAAFSIMVYCFRIAAAVCVTLISTMRLSGVYNLLNWSFNYGCCAA
jgi:GPI mannosyltransferase 1 subunit M